MSVLHSSLQIDHYCRSDEQVRKARSYQAISLHDRMLDVSNVLCEDCSGGG
jgi:hypothetical protein